MKKSLIQKFLGMITSVFKRDDAPKPKRKYKKRVKKVDSEKDVIDKIKREFPEPIKETTYKVEPEDLSTVALNIEIESREKAVLLRKESLTIAKKQLMNATNDDDKKAAGITLAAAEDALKIAEDRLKESTSKDVRASEVEPEVLEAAMQEVTSETTLTTGRYTTEDKAIVKAATDGYGLAEVNFEKLAATLNRDIKAVKQRVRKQYK